jgi:hypothetical protein
MFRLDAFRKLHLTLHSRYVLQVQTDFPFVVISPGKSGSLLNSGVGEVAAMARRNVKPASSFL